jgi:sarcosine oxidase
MQHFDVIVVGVGSMGASTCWHLASQGHKVLGIEQFNIPHDRGSYGGQTRIIRKAYFEHPDYVPLLARAYENWDNLEKETGAKIYNETGLAYFGKATNPAIKNSKKSADLYNIPFEHSTSLEGKQKFPQFEVPADFETYFEPKAGFLLSEKIINLYTQEAVKKGACIHSNENVQNWVLEGENVRVNTDKSSYSAAKVIFTAGAWASKVLPNLKSNLTVNQQMLAFANPSDWKLFEVGNCPCWFVADDDLGLFYGFPILDAGTYGGQIGFKLGLHVAGPEINPDSTKRKSTLKDEKVIHNFLKKYIPKAENHFLSVKTCLYTYSTDEDFIIDFLPNTDQKVMFAAGFSGHGFKFASVVGEILADLAVKGKTEQPIAFLGLDRLTK